jgi:alkylhydroperoxidase family enzyme
LTEAQVRDIDRGADSPAYSDLERAVLRFCDEWTRQTHVSPELMQYLGRHLTPAQLVTLAGTVSLAGWTNKFGVNFGLELP